MDALCDSPTPDQLQSKVTGGGGVVDVILSKLQRSPETLSHKELRRIPLSALSKGLGLLTPRRVINAYLRWLEVQRKAPRRNINHHWLNTITNWTQALRARGFPLEEVNRGVTTWKEGNGPFVEPRPSDPESRLPPTLSNLAYAWERTPTTTKIVSLNEVASDLTLSTMPKKYDSRLERKLESALIDVPASYICNRCKGRGHYVGDCPTNEDPKYDIPAGFDYVCKFCKERGTHYFMFCPRNPDRNSIYRRRQDKALQNSSSRRDLELNKTTAPPPESPDPATARLKTGVLSFAGSPTNDFEDFTQGRRISSRGETTGRCADDNDVDSIGMSMRGVVMGDLRDKTMTRGNSPGLNRSELSDPSEGQMVWERLTNDIQREHLLGPQKKLRECTKPIAIEGTETKQIQPITTNQSPHADFLTKLFAKHPSQPGPKRRPRMTALEMWDMNDEKKCREESEELSKVSERELSDSGVLNSMDVDREDYLKTSKEHSKEVGVLVHTAGIKKQEKEQEKELVRAKKLHAIQTKINSIEGLRTKLASWEEVKSPEMEQMAGGDLSQEDLDDISRRVRSPEPPSPSRLTSLSSELSSPPGCSKNGSSTTRDIFRTT